MAPKVAAPPPVPPTLLEAAASQIDAELYDFMREVVSELDYAPYQADFTAEEYRKAARLALYELWGYRREGIDKSGADYKRQLGVLDDHIAWLHTQPAYARLKQELRASFDRLASPKSYIDHTQSPRDQTRLYRAYRRIALHADDLKVRELAGRAFKETFMPVVKVRHTEARVIHMDARTAQLIAETFGMMKEFHRAGASDQNLHAPAPAGNAEGGRQEPLLLQSGRPGPEPADA